MACKLNVIPPNYFITLKLITDPLSQIIYQMREGGVFEMGWATWVVWATGDLDEMGTSHHVKLFLSLIFVTLIECDSI